MHQGIDFAGPVGAEVVAVAAGIVTDAGDREHEGYGKLVEINHGNGYVTRYGHNSSISVKVGDRVIKGLAERIVATKKAGHDVCVVVSAMGDTTDELLELANEVAPIPAPRSRLGAGQAIRP